MIFYDYEIYTYIVLVKILIHTLSVLKSCNIQTTQVSFSHLYAVWMNPAADFSPESIKINHNYH